MRDYPTLHLNTNQSKGTDIAVLCFYSTSIHTCVSTGTIKNGQN